MKSVRQIAEKYNLDLSCEKDILGYVEYEKNKQRLKAGQHETSIWHSVEEKLPEHEQFVLVTNGKRVVRARLQNNHIWFFSDHSSIGILVTHWMPLPKPPQAT
jgi:hypothetical protein